MSFSILRLDQLIGPEKLDLFNKIDIDAETTGYASIRGADSYKLSGKYFAKKGKEVKSELLDKTCAPYWTSTKAKKTLGSTYAIKGLDAAPVTAWDDNTGVRVCVPFAEIANNARDMRTINTDNGPIKEFIYGEMPQRTVKHEEAEELWKKYESGELKPTGRTYSAWGYKVELFYDGNEYAFEKDEYPEYEINGHRYVMTKLSTFHNGSPREKWVEVEPIEWYLDEKSGLAISKKVLLGGMPISKKGIYFGNFDNTVIGKFLDEEFGYDIEEKRQTKENVLNDMLEEEEELKEEKRLTL